MYRYDEFDHTLVAERVGQFRDQVVRRLAGDIDEEQFRPLRLMNGLYLQLHAYMLRRRALRTESIPLVCRPNRSPARSASSTPSNTSITTSPGVDHSTARPVWSCAKPSVGWSATGRCGH